MTVAELRPLRAAQEEWRRAYLVEAYAVCGGNKAHLARALDIDPSQVWRLLKRYQIDRPTKVCEG